MKRWSSLLATCVLLVSFCKGAGKPPEVDKWTSCALDGNRIEDIALAAVARSSSGVVKAFDTTSCLIRTIPSGEDWQVWFHDHDGPDWIPAKKAVFLIQRAGAGGPVRYVRAFKSKDAAVAFYEHTPGRNEIAPDYQTLRAVLENP